ncbi:MAG: 23S rRNA (uracil(1939)-C(5))-methyltransferase RlmD [Candidatus Latescibacteria bacterium]|nr:23S rRNA (uracil(1939)-C(5))-methyltransferase RlmD [Candidatus Latescibacterota bacterium]
MKRGDYISVEVESMSRQGDGLAWVDGREVALPGTMPGDRVEARIWGKRKGRFNGDVESFSHRAVERQVPICRHFGVCGGCRWQDIPYAEQLRVKQGMVQQALQNEGIVSGELRPIQGSEAALCYRNKMEFSFGQDRQGQLQLGMHIRDRFNRLFNIEHCHLQSGLSNQIVQCVRYLATAAGLPPYNLKSHLGLLRFLVVRQSKYSGEIMVSLVVSQYPNPDVDRLVDGVLAAVPQISTFIVALHQGKAQVAQGEQEFVLKGPGRIIERCGGIDFAISPRSFFQTNSLQVEQLYQCIADLAGSVEEKNVLDLFCGTGGISLYLARSAKKVTGVEIVEEAIADARDNARRNGLNNTEFIAGPVEKVWQQALVGGTEYDLVVLDPPRAGVHKRALAALVELRPPRVIYVSCNPQSLAEDLAVLQEGGYQAECLQPVDMFPQTPHCEVVVRLGYVANKSL